MTDKINLSAIGSGYSAQTNINNNFDAVEEAFDNTISRDGSAPNYMEAELDMNSHPIVNVGSPTAANDAARWIDVTDAVNLTGTAVPALAGNEDKFLGTTDGVTLSFGRPPAYFPVTAEEALASISVTDDTYPEFDIRRYASNVDGTTDNSTFIQAFVDYCHDYKQKIVFRAIPGLASTVYVATGIDLYEDDHVESEQGVTIRSSTTAAFSNVFNTISTTGVATALTANVAKGATTVDVTSASGLSVGQLVIIRDATYKFSTSGRNLELNEIASIASLTITLKNATIGAYTTAATAELLPITTPARRVKIENVKVDIPSGKKGGAFYFQEAYDCDVINCVVTGMEDQAAVQTWRSAYIRIFGGTFSDGQSLATPGSGYGIGFGEACHHCTATNVTTRNIRENAVSLNSRFCVMTNCTAWAPYDNGFNSHANGAEDCDFINCAVYSSRVYSFLGGFSGSNAADKRIRFINCVSVDSGSYAFWSGADSGRENEDIEFINCIAIRPGRTTATNYGYYISRCTRPKITNCRVDGGGSANVRAGMLIEICTNAVVRLGEIYNCTSGWGIIHTQCTGILIDGLHIIDVGGSQGVHATGTASTKVFVTNCRVNNDVVFTKNTGDVHRDNFYNTKLQNTLSVSSGTVSDGGTIAHGIVTTPVAYGVSTTVAGEFASVTAVSSTNLTIALKKHDNTAGTTQILHFWAAY